MDEQLRKLIAGAIESLDYQMAGLSSGRVSVNDWQIGVAQDLLVHHYAAYMAGAESKDIPVVARQRLNGLIGQQIERLNMFADSLEGRDVTPADEARLRLYAEALKASHSMGVTGSFSLPAYPGDGSTPCIGHCGCRWEERADGFYWVRGKSDSCSVCKQRAGDWAPYRE